MIQTVLQSKLLWYFIGIIGRYQFKYCTNGYIRLVGKKTGDYYPYIRFSYTGDDMWYYRADGEVGEITYKNMIRMSNHLLSMISLKQSNVAKYLWGALC